MITCKETYTYLSEDDTRLLLLLDCILIHPTLFEEHLLKYSPLSARFISEKRKLIQTYRKEYTITKGKIHFLDLHHKFPDVLHNFIQSFKCGYSRNVFNMLFYAPAFERDLTHLDPNDLTLYDENYTQEEDFFLFLSPFYLETWLKDIVFDADTGNLETFMRFRTKFQYYKFSNQHGVECWRHRMDPWLKKNNIKLPEYLLENNDLFKMDLDLKVNPE